MVLLDFSYTLQLGLSIQVKRHVLFFIFPVDPSHPVLLETVWVGECVQGEQIRWVEQVTGLCRDYNFVSLQVPFSSLYVYGQ